MNLFKDITKFVLSVTLVTSCVSTKGIYKATDYNQLIKSVAPTLMYSYQYYEYGESKVAKDLSLEITHNNVGYLSSCNARMPAVDEEFISSVCEHISGYRLMNSKESELHLVLRFTDNTIHIVEKDILHRSFSNMEIETKATNLPKENHIELVTDSKSPLNTEIKPAYVRKRSKPIDISISKESFSLHNEKLCIKETGRKKYIYDKPNPKNTSLHFYVDSIIKNIEKQGNLLISSSLVNAKKADNQVVLELAINKDGSFCGFRFIESHNSNEEFRKLITKILTRVSPFPAFPASLASDYDTIHIIKTWKFIDRS